MTYRSALVSRFWQYQASRFPDRERYFELPRQPGGRPPVFIKREAHHNVIVDPTAAPEDVQRVLGVIPRHERHKWFGSMASSQALAQSVFGNLAVRHMLTVLKGVTDDSGLPLLGDATPDAFRMEAKVSTLGEPRPTSFDVCFSGTYRVGFECKFTESEVGTCSRPRLPAEDAGCCNGSYSTTNAKLLEAGIRVERCPLTTLGVKYWKYVPEVFSWPADQDFAVCPLDANYQLVRNVLATCIGADGRPSAAGGHVVLIYDERNPAFQAGGKGFRAFQETRGALKDSYLNVLRKCSWQRIAAVLRQAEVPGFLTDELATKYGL